MIGLPEMIKNSENRIVFYKATLYEFSQVKPTEDTEWYKSLIRELKNEEQSHLKELIKRKTYENQGLDDPYSKARICPNPVECPLK